MLGVSPFIELPANRNGNSFEVWLDEAIRESEIRSKSLQASVAAGHIPEALAVAAEQARRTLVAVRSAI